MDREQVFQWLSKKEFDKIIKFLKTGQQAVSEDNIIQAAIGHFFNEIIESANRQMTDDTLFIFSQLFILHTKNFFIFSKPHFETIVIQLVRNTASKDDAFFYASALPENSVCAELIIKHNEAKPKEVVHSQVSKIKVHEVISENRNLTKSIFNSKQENIFFFALRNCFPNYYIYPNISLSTVVNYSLVENDLESSEKRFFFNTTIDFVVIDQFNDFKPIFSVELDSEWHRLHNQGSKDEIKNKILKSIGLPLYRIEHMNKNKTVEEFEKIIIETINLTHKQDSSH